MTYFGKACNPTPDGLAADSIAKIFGCPDCPGMAELVESNPTKYKFCYWIKRPTGQLGLAAAIAGVLFLFMRK